MNNDKGKKERIKFLESEILHHKKLYYSGQPQINDVEFDKIEHDLRNLDPDNYVLHVVGIGFSLNNKDSKIKHEKKMLSLDKTYNIDDLKSWLDGHEYVSTFKIDGISCSLIYEDGRLALAKTRGNGVTGENIGEKVVWIKSIPKSIYLKEKFEIRGELYCTENDFIHLSDEMVSRGFERPTSQRNIVAGLIGRKEISDLCSYLKFSAFELLTTRLKLKHEWDKYHLLHELHFETPGASIHKDVHDLDLIINRAQNFMTKGDYQIDGIVFIYNDLQMHEELGETAHHPRYKLALKFAGETKRSIIREITWTISRNGTLTPVGIIEPINLSGATISRVTLHNYGIVRQYQLKVGDEIEIIRSGEVIPKFLARIRTSNLPFTIPSHCTSCHKPIHINDIRLVCLNPNCPGKNKEGILNFISKINIDDLSVKRLEELIEKSLVNEIPDLYKLAVDDFLKLDKVKDKLSQKLYESIQKSKETDLVTFLAALGIKGGAFSKCEKIVLNGINSIEKIKNLTYEQLIQVESFAEKSANEFLSSLQSKKETIDELLKLGFQIRPYIVTQHIGQLSGKKICITGTLSRKREEVECDLRLVGAIVTNSVSKTTDYLLTNEKDPTSNKYKKAIEYNVPIIDESELMNLIGKN